MSDYLSPRTVWVDGPDFWELADRACAQLRTPSRDQLAMAAMQGVVSNTMVTADIYNNVSASLRPNHIARVSYDIADAMLAERDKKTEAAQ